MTLGFQCVTGKMRRKFSISFTERTPGNPRRALIACFVSSRLRPLRENTEPQKVYLRTKNSLLRAFFFVGCCLLLVSCFDTGDCLFSNTNVIKVNIMNSARPLEQMEVKFDSVFTPDKLLYLDGDTVATFGLLADPTVTETTYIFQYNERSDTLVLGYSNQTFVLSPDCGSYLFQSDLQVKYSTFGTDRVVIKDPKLLTTVPLNVEILL